MNRNENRIAIFPSFGYFRFCHLFFFFRAKRERTICTLLRIKSVMAQQKMAQKLIKFEWKLNGATTETITTRQEHRKKEKKMIKWKCSKIYLCLIGSGEHFLLSLNNHQQRKYDMKECKRWFCAKNKKTTTTTSKQEFDWNPVRLMPKPNVHNIIAFWIEA